MSNERVIAALYDRLYGEPPGKDHREDCQWVQFDGYQECSCVQMYSLDKELAAEAKMHLEMEK